MAPLILPCRLHAATTCLATGDHPGESLLRRSTEAGAAPLQRRVLLVHSSATQQEVRAAVQSESMPSAPLPHLFTRVSSPMASPWNNPWGTCSSRHYFHSDVPTKRERLAAYLWSCNTSTPLAYAVELYTNLTTQSAHGLTWVSTPRDGIFSEAESPARS